MKKGKGVGFRVISMTELIDIQRFNLTLINHSKVDYSMISLSVHSYSEERVGYPLSSGGWEFRV